MATTIDVAFIKQFEAEVHEAYQRQGSILRGMARTKNNIVGLSTTFQKVGKGQAGTKARHGLVPVMDVPHTNVECTLADYYAGDWVDKLDEYKINIPERQLLANAGAWALGRKTDELILTALGTTTTTAVGDGTTNLTVDLVLAALEVMNNNDVPAMGQKFAVLTPHQWAAMEKIEQFVNADYTGPLLPFMGNDQRRSWKGVLWIMHSGVPDAGTNDMNVYIWHETAIGHAIGAQVETDITWHGDRYAHFIANAMSQGAVLIDADGVVPINVDDTATYASA